MGMVLPGSNNNNNRITYRFEKSTNPATERSSAQRKFSDKTHSKSAPRIVFQHDGKDLPGCAIRIQSMKTYDSLDAAAKKSLLDKAYKVIFGHDRWVPLQIGEANGKPQYVKVNYSSLHERLFLDEGFKQVKKEVRANSLSERKVEHLGLFGELTRMGIERVYYSGEGFRVKVGVNRYGEDLRPLRFYAKYKNKAKMLSAPDTGNLQSVVVKKLEEISFGDQAKKINADMKSAKKFLSNIDRYDVSTGIKALDFVKTSVNNLRRSLVDLDRLIEKGWEKGAEVRAELVSLISDMESSPKRLIDTLVKKIERREDVLGRDRIQYDEAVYVYKAMQQIVNFMKENPALRDEEVMQKFDKYSTDLLGKKLTSVYYSQSTSLMNIGHHLTLGEAMKHLKESTQ